MVILGIDPGTATTGWGVIKKTKSRKQKVKSKKTFLKCLDFGLIETNPSLTPAERLKKINKELKKIIKKYKPKILAVENVYFFKNLKTALPISEAKGVIIFTAAQKEIPVLEFTPLQVKMAIGGYGRAEKKQIQKMIKILLNLKEIPQPDDIADALGVAICCARFKNL